MTTIAVLDYGMGNLLSVERAIAHVGGDVQITGDANGIGSAAGLVIPGVGHFGACMRALAHHGLDRAVLDFSTSGRPVFGVCLGMQVLFDGSEEGPADGLGIVAGRVRRLPATVKVPHMGWNTVEWSTHPYVADIAKDAWFYFVHSYAAPPSAVTTGVTAYGEDFSAAISQGNVFATQFHPEKSGDAGLKLYRNFVKAVAAA